MSTIGSKKTQVRHPLDHLVDGKTGLQDVWNEPIDATAEALPGDGDDEGGDVGTG